VTTSIIDRAYSFGVDNMHGIFYVLISVCFNIFGQYSMKRGMQRFGEVTFDNHILLTIVKMFMLPNVLLGLFFYAISTVFWLIALSKIELSVAYPMLSIGYVLLMILSYFLLNESITVYKVIGTLLVVVGITLISK
jgi:multidrug transporter EmrE-like cation transporter